MRAILLAAGLGKRLQPLTNHIPKCMAPVNGRPLLQYWLDALFSAGVESVLVNLHHRSRLVQEFLDAHPLRARIRLAHEERLLGTAGTLLANRDFCRGDSVMLIHGDNLCGADLRSFMAAHVARADRLPITMMTFVTDRPKECGIVVADEEGIVQEFHEKVAAPPGNLASAAVFILESRVYSEHPQVTDELDFSREVLPGYVGRIGVFHNDVYHRDLGNVQAWLRAQWEWAGAIPAPIVGDSWCGFANQLASAAGTELRAMLEGGASGIGCDGVVEYATYEEVAPNGRPTPRGSPGPLYFFWRAPAGFSSRGFLETYGARSVVMMAGSGT